MVSLALRAISEKMEELRMNKVILCDFAESVAAGATPSTELAGDVAIEVSSPADLAGMLLPVLHP